MKTVISESSNIANLVAERIKALLDVKIDAVLAFSAGESMKGLFNLLGDMCASGELSFKNVRLLAVSEFVNSTEYSCRKALTEGLFSRIDISAENCFFPDPNTPEAYDWIIESLGGIDLAVLGIGVNAHIAYNEPATPFDTLTHIQRLTGRTKKQLLSRGFMQENIPEFAVTMGIQSIIRARQIILLAYGEEKADAVFQMVYGKTITYIPASFLQIPINVTAYIDNAAAAKL